MPDAYLLVKVKKQLYVVNEVNKWNRSIGGYLRGSSDDYASKSMQEEEMSGFCQLNQASVMQISLSLGFLPTCKNQDKIIKEFFFQSSPWTVFPPLNNQV